MSRFADSSARPTDAPKSPQQTERRRGCAFCGGSLPDGPKLWLMFGLGFLSQALIYYLSGSL